MWEGYQHVGAHTLKHDKPSTVQMEIPVWAEHAHFQVSGAEENPHNGPYIYKDKALHCTKGRSLSGKHTRIFR